MEAKPAANGAAAGLPPGDTRSALEEGSNPEEINKDKSNTGKKKHNTLAEAQSAAKEKRAEKGQNEHKE
eukprot:6670316-Ditylum_brightwellii.AAC.1